jgi:hypothetical protein
MPKKTLVLSAETEEIWRRLWPTKGASSESGAFAQFLFDLDAALRNRLDPEALEQYERGELTRSEMGRAFERYRARKAAANGGAEKQPAVV